MAKFILGTRASLLAVTQSTLVKNQLELLFPEHTFSLKTIKTQGDLVTDRPLWQLEGKDFFTKELDDALLNNEVDFVVHSYKDLSTIRPDKIFLAAITKRFLANDILLIKKTTTQQLTAKTIKKLKIGTSSPRRQFLLTNDLKKLLPYGESLEISFDNLRGNVNTRISKLNDGLYDAICLAAAGLDRLASHPNSLEELKLLTNALDFKILPLSLFPSAPAQGALAIECSISNNSLKNILKSLHCETTAEEVQAEKKIFQSYGGGCHLALGVMCKKLTNGIKIVMAKGNVNSEEININKIDEVPFKIVPPTNYKYDTPLVFTGLSNKRHLELNLNNMFISDEHKEIKYLKHNNEVINSENIFYLTSEHTIPFFESLQLKNSPIWCSGLSLHEKLSQLGFWGQGDSESFGHEILNNFKNSNLGKFLWGRNEILEVTFSSKKNSAFKFIGAYESIYENLPRNEFKDKLSTCKYFFWTSKSQFEYYHSNYKQIIENKNVFHFCGIGKTYKHIKTSSDILVSPVANINTFIKALQKELSKRL